MDELNCFNPFWIMAVFYIGFFAWINMFRVAHSTFPKIKEHEINLYKKIIVQDGKGWLERGWYSPADVDVQFRLYRAIYCGEANKLLSHRSWRGYVWSARICITAFIIVLVGAIVIIACYTSISYEKGVKSVY